MSTNKQPTSPAVVRLTEDIADILDGRVAPLFKPGVKLTLMARYPDNPEADVLVSSDTDEGIQAVLDRSKTRPIVEAAHG